MCATRTLPIVPRLYKPLCQYAPYMDLQSSTLRLQVHVPVPVRFSPIHFVYTGNIPSTTPALLAVLNSRVHHTATNRPR